VGDPREHDTQIGPLVNEDALERVTEHFEDAVAKGAKVITGGKAHGLFFNPTVLTDVGPEMRVYSEESFGPIVAIVPVDGVDEAIRVANDTEYGLSAAVFSSDVDAALAVASQLQTGMCHINDATVNDEPPMPFGGVKDSGWGRFGGKAALEEFTELRWITIQDSPRDYPI
jgi:vanillin dehydrogenase